MCQGRTAKNPTVSVFGGFLEGIPAPFRGLTSWLIERQENFPDAKFFSELNESNEEVDI
jgi:hypothetical protein